MSKIDEIISKSLNEIDDIINSASDINKSIKPGEVSEDAPQEGEEGTGEGEEGTEEEGAEEGTEEEGTDTDTDEVGDGDNDEDDVEKSELETDLAKSENASSALEVSDFLAELVKSIANVINNQRMDINKSMESTNHQGELLAQSFSGLAKSQRAVIQTQAELAKGLNMIAEKLDAYMGQPMARKSKPSVQIVEKSFKSSLGDSKGGKGVESLTKSEALQKLTSEFSNGNPSLASDVLAFESTGDFNILSPQAKTVLGIK